MTQSPKAQSPAAQSPEATSQAVQTPEVQSPVAQSPELADPVQARQPADAGGVRSDEPTRPLPVARRSLGRSALLRLLAFVGVVFVLLAAIWLGLRVLNVVPGFGNPFGERTTDRSQPVLLQSMRDLSRFVAADGTFQVIVDLQEDRENIPEFLVSRRTLFVGSGTVQQYVEFGGLAENAVRVRDDRSVEITLPAPQQSQAALDLQRSYVVAEQRGLFNRISDAFRSNPAQQQRVYGLAQQRITEAASQSGLEQRARDNTQKMLQSLLSRLGYTTVTVTFTAP